MNQTLCVVLATGVAGFALSADYIWLGGDGLFSDSTKWVPEGVPMDGDRAKFSTADDGTVTWTGDVSNHEFQIVETAGNTLTLDLSGNTYTVTNRFSFDGSKASSYVVISNGFLTAPTNLCEMKINAGITPARLTFADRANVTLNAFTFYRSEVNVETGAVVTFNGECKINESQTGAYTTMNINGGAVVCNNHFKCPDNGQPGSTSVLSIASGSLLAKNYFSVGDKNGSASVGMVNLSGGYLETWGTVWLGNSGGACGIANVSGGKWGSKGNFEVSHREYTSAYLNMSGGEIELATGKYFGIAYGGGTIACDTGTVSMTGGRIVATNTGCNFYVGAGSNCFGRCTVGGSGIILSRDFYVASSSFSEGDCLVTGGVVLVNNSLSVGGANLGVGRMRISGGAVTNLASSYIGNNTGSQGTLAVDGGILMVSNTLNVGQNAAAAGAVQVRGGTVLANYLVCGNNGMGDWVQSNGTTAVGTDLTIGVNGTGTVEVVDGGFTVGGIAYLGKNVRSSGKLTLSGGRVAATKGIRVGDWGGSGTLLMVDGTLASGTGGSFSIGNGNGSTGRVVQTGGLLDIKNALYVGSSGNGTLGRLEVAGGELAVSNQLVVGNNPFSYGEVLVSGGTVWVGDDIRLGVSTNTYGYLTVTGGSITNADYIDVGHSGTGILHVAGGEVVTKILRLTPYSYTNGAPVAEVIVSGGLLHVTNTFYCADALNSTSKVSLLGGTLKLPQLWNNRGYTAVRCDGGELETTRNDANFINANVQRLELTAGGLFVDSAGFDIGTSRDLPDALGGHGKLGKRGLGKFELRGNTTFTGPVVVEGGELTLGSSGLITLAGGCQIDGGALLNLSARALDFTLPAGTVSRVDGELRLAVGKTLTVASGATLGGTGTVGRVVFEAGATLSRSAAHGAALLNAAECVLPAGAVISLTGYSEADLLQGVTVVSAGTLNLAPAASVTVLLDGVPQSPVALRVSGGTLTVSSYNPATLIRVQ